MTPRLASSCAYLFEDLHEEMKPILESDPVIDRIRTKQKSIAARIDDRAAKGADIQEQIALHDEKIRDIERELANARRLRGSVLGGLTVLTAQNAGDRRLILQLNKDISRREDELTSREAERRLRDLGRDLRAAKGIKIPRIGGGYVRTFSNDKDYQSQTDTPSERVLLRPTPGAEGLQPGDQEQGRSREAADSEPS